MIEFPVIVGSDGRPIVVQKIAHPAIYLDTWALRLFAEDDHALGERFRNALLGARGTLMLSFLSIGEFTQFADPRHARQVGEFTESIIPFLFFSRFDPFPVIQDELLIACGQRNGTPAGDMYLLELYAKSRSQHGGRNSIRNWFVDMQADRRNTGASVQEMAGRFLAAVAELRERLATEPNFVKLARDNIKASILPRATQALLRALIYRLDPKMALTVNDALDIGHFLVPAAYADFVLLDRRWYLRVEDARNYLRGEGIETRIAEQYTQRDGGVLKFLERLEGWTVG